MKYSWARMQGGMEGKLSYDAGPVTALIDSMGALELENTLENCSSWARRPRSLYSHT